MAQFVAFDSHVEVLSDAVAAVVTAMGKDAEPILAKYGLANVQAGEWYLQQNWLNVFKEVSQAINASVNLVSVGMRIPETAVFPPEINSIPSALHSIDVAYHM